MQEKIEWNLYAELEAEVMALLDVVKETLASSGVPAPNADEKAA